MKVKRYVAMTIQEAINDVKSELGQDAIIMSTRKIRQKGWFGWLKKPLVEVVAAVDDVISTYQGSNSVVKETKQDEVVAGINKKEQVLENLERKVDAMGDMINKLLQGINVVPSKSKYQLSDECSSYYKLLTQNEVEGEFAEKLIKLAWDEKEKKNIDFAMSMEDIILKSLGIPKPLELKHDRKTTALFLGPTGVGKTTTLAKLAAIYSIQHQKRVGLITADTYRIAAVDQLKIYAEILGIPLSIIYSPGEIKDALQYHEDKDIILIDTAGKSINNRDQEKEISQLLSFGNIDEIYLAIGSNTTYKGCVNIIESYRFLPDYKLLFTKIDEITSYGTILNCCLLAQKPLSYFTTGQDVPDDIEVADPEKIKNLLLGSL